VTLHAAIPGVNGTASSSASDIAAAITQALSPSLPDLRVTLYASQSQLLLTGSPNSIRIARELIAKLDALPQMVVLDVTILEVDENVSKMLGLQQFSRTPLSIGFQLNLLIQNGKAKVLADPKLTTLSGRTASLRAGDNIAILTTTGGSVGTVATTQLVTFNTGVQLDITPVINADNFVSVTLHPTVNNLSSILNGVPQISTRDVQTTVAMREGQTLIIGGLIEDSLNRSETHIPVLGYLPIVGPFFTQTIISGQRNELIITVTPHIVDPLTSALPASPSSYVELPSDALASAAASPSAAPAPFVAATPSAGRIAQAPPGSFVFGTRPPSLPSAGPNDPPKIFYVLATPQFVKQGTTISIEAVTSPNVTRVVVQLGSASVSLHQAGPGLWDATVPFSMPNTSQMAQVPALLSAVRADGVAATLNIPLTLMP